MSSKYLLCVSINVVSGFKDVNCIRVKQVGVGIPLIFFKEQTVVPEVYSRDDRKHIGHILEKGMIF